MIVMLAIIIILSFFLNWVERGLVCISKPSGYIFPQWHDISSQKIFVTCDGQELLPV